MNKLLKKPLSSYRDYLAYVIVIFAFLAITIVGNTAGLSSKISGLLVPTCCYIIMALSLNLTVGIMGELSLGHAGFMSVGAFTAIVVSQSLLVAVPNPVLRFVIAVLCSSVAAAAAGFLIGIPVLRLKGDYLAIVTLAFGEIIKDLVNCLIVGRDSNGIHIIFNIKGDKSVADLNLLDDGIAIIKGAQGAVGTKTISSFTAGFVLIIITLFIVINFVRSRTGRAVLAIRDNRIAAESVGINIMKYKMITFVISTMLAGVAGALYGLNFSSLVSSKFNFNTSILVLVFVVLGGLGNMTGSVIAAAVLYILPEALRQFSDYRMLIYAIILIVVMIATNSKKVKDLLAKIIPTNKDKKVDVSASGKEGK